MEIIEIQNNNLPELAASSVYQSLEEYGFFEKGLLPDKKACDLPKCGHALEEHSGGHDNEGSYSCDVCGRYCQAGGQWFDMEYGEWRD